MPLYKLHFGNARFALFEAEDDATAEGYALFRLPKIIEKHGWGVPDTIEIHQTSAEADISFWSESGTGQYRLYEEVLVN